MDAHNNLYQPFIKHIIRYFFISCFDVLDKALINRYFADK